MQQVLNNSSVSYNVFVQACAGPSRGKLTISRSHHLLGALRTAMLQRITHLIFPAACTQLQGFSHVT